MDESLTEEIISGSWGIITILVFCLFYDLFAINSAGKIKTKRKVQTLSGFVWHSLEKPTKAAGLIGSWTLLTYHLFGEKRARQGYKNYANIRGSAK